MSLGAIFGALSGASGLLGLFGHRSNDGAQSLLNQGQNYYNKAGDYLSGEGGIGSQYGSLAGQSLGNYQNYEGQYNQALGGYGNYLRQDPYTDQYSTQALAGATSGTAQAYQGAKAALTSDLASRGFQGASSMLGGGLAGINQGEAATMGAAQNQLAYNKVAANQGRLSSLAGLYGGAAQNAYSMGTSALGGEMGADQAAAGGYENMGNNYIAQGQNLQQQNAQYNQGLNGMVGAGLSGLGSYLGWQNAGGGGMLGGLGVPSTPGIAPTPGVAPSDPYGLTQNYGLAQNYGLTQNYGLGYGF